MNIRQVKSRGNVLFGLLLVLLTSIAGYVLSGKLIEWTGADRLTAAVPFFATLMGLFLTPLYALYRQLADLKKVTILTQTEQERVDELVDIKMRTMVSAALFYLFAAGYMTSARFWPLQSDFSLLLTKAAVVLVCVAALFVVYIFVGFMEAHRFEARLERRAQKAEERQDLLDKLSAKNA